MKKYSYKDIKKVTQMGILFIDGFEILFEECRDEWSSENKIEKEESVCIGIRNFLEVPPYFIFYSKERVKVFFNKRGIFAEKKNRIDFHNLQATLNRYGFLTYDMT